ncbi:hypothetical protein SUGI_0371080 [Cryptomeria japonica]|uniref:uncharacterized protein LOC131028515 n=1 Tax=Cryptomeria japonica TaxID=3369 RepID=UPI002408E9BA|nr:uncharacterized protein LOC131028515 [Cryptomeria japonica]GLJ20425.1 hypothetical protein SUGI_0371080 [Cryptomeria japonica]
MQTVKNTAAAAKEKLSNMASYPNQEKDSTKASDQDKNKEQGEHNKDERREEGRENIRKEEEKRESESDDPVLGVISDEDEDKKVEKIITMAGATGPEVVPPGGFV